MAGVTYKCPNCGAYLTFDPDSQQWKCPFCSSAFPETELKGKAEAFQKEADKEAEQFLRRAGGLPLPQLRQRDHD